MTYQVAMLCTGSNDEITLYKPGRQKMRFTPGWRTPTSTPHYCNVKPHITRVWNYYSNNSNTSDDFLTTWPSYYVRSGTGMNAQLLLTAPAEIDINILVFRMTNSNGATFSAIITSAINDIFDKHFYSPDAVVIPYNTGSFGFNWALNAALYRLRDAGILTYFGDGTYASLDNQIRAANISYGAANEVPIWLDEQGPFFSFCSYLGSALKHGTGLNAVRDAILAEHPWLQQYNV